MAKYKSVKGVSSPSASLTNLHPLERVAVEAFKNKCRVVLGQQLSQLEKKLYDELGLTKEHVQTVQPYAIKIARVAVDEILGEMQKNYEQGLL